MEWIRRQTMDGQLSITRDRLANDFIIDGQRIPLIDRGRGIRKPAGWDAALSITTSVPASGRARPYDDAEGSDGLHRYKLRRDQRGSSENAGLRMAMNRRLPLIWFYGLTPANFQAIFPVYLVAEEPAESQFVLALTEDQRSIQPGSPVEATLRRYLIAETKRRLHQPVFANQVMLAYETACAVCSLAPSRAPRRGAHHRGLLPRRGAGGAERPGSRKIHHAAYDQNILGSAQTSSSRSTAGCSTRSTGRCCAMASRSITAGR